MNKIQELPFYSPHRKAKLYSQHDERVRLPLNPEELMGEEEYRNWQMEMNQYRNYKEFKWVFDGEIQNTQSAEATPGLIDRCTFATIKTNSLHDIQPGDVLRLQCVQFPNGKYFIITGQVKQEYAYTPKMRPTYKIMEVRSLL